MCLGGLRGLEVDGAAWRRGRVYVCVPTSCGVELGIE